MIRSLASYPKNDKEAAIIRNTLQAIDTKPYINVAFKAFSKELSYTFSLLEALVCLDTKATNNIAVNK